MSPLFGAYFPSLMSSLREVVYWPGDPAAWSGTAVCLACPGHREGLGGGVAGPCDDKKEESVTSTCHLGEHSSCAYDLL